MGKVLFVATVRSHIGQFHMDFIKYLNSQGHIVDVACKDNSADKKGLDLTGVNKFYFMNFSRSPYSADNLKAKKALTKLLKKESYDIIHCHTPMGAVVARLSAHAAKSKATVIYTAHGFHFFKGAPKLNWALFYPIEKYLSRYTDCLITINQEDYDVAVNGKFKAGKIIKVDGVGLDLSKFVVVSKEKKEELREKLGFNKEDFILIYTADLSVRKNQSMLIRAIAKVKDSMPNVKVLLPGQPILLDEYKQLSDELGISDIICFMGYRRDINLLLAAADIAVSVSKQEGLPVNLMEAMAVGKPILVTDVRGNADLVEDGVNGYKVTLNDVDAFAEKLLYLYNNKQDVERMGKKGTELVEKYSYKNVNSQLAEIYNCYGDFFA